MELTRSLCLDAVKWCQEKYGLSKYHRKFPKLIFRRVKPPKEEELLGEYYWNENLIVIYKTTCDTYDDPVMQLIATVIHEYKHYLQNMKKYDMYFDKYHYKYESHPYEKTCNKFADREMFECYYYVTNKKKYKKKLNAA